MRLRIFLCSALACVSLVLLLCVGGMECDAGGTENYPIIWPPAYTGLPTDRITEVVQFGYDERGDAILVEKLNFMPGRCDEWYVSAD